MDFKNIVVNGLKMPIAEESTIKDIITKFFDLRSEFLVTRNAKPIPNHRYQLCRVKENDNLQIVSYSKYPHQLHKRSIFRLETER